MKNVKKNLKNYFSNGPKTIFVVMLLLTCITVTIFNMQKAISVIVDGKSIEVTTLKSNVTQILKSNNIALGAKDQITVSLDSKVKDGDKIYIKKAVNVKVTVDGKTRNIQTAEKTVEAMLKAEKIVLSDKDKITPSKSDSLKSGLAVNITRVNTENRKETKTVDFATETKSSGELKKGVKKVIQKGKVGQKVITSAVVFENGKEVSKKLLSENLNSKPVKEIIALGTANVYTPSRGGDIKYTKKMKVRATAYTADLNCTGKGPNDPGLGITSTGNKAKRNPGGYSTIAVDPSVIPLGTKLWVEGYGYAIADDIGGAIKGNVIDLYYDSSEESYDWGSRNVNIYLMN
ncbi:ubiquitin-like domain-containing protein [Clostridium algoriphilum]|uniref:ubiquitin-like domain-containing protein n=1 Tax=Clostridium algoriphilum TaxID=198347 RepID=UPI001CF2E44B|nr:ubiquitin-like domain-containing protein [Clostridium algoriphilum]MCB2293099.1 ubiquitin-like domain-containing protein [Clostridium algoriphilum]